MVVYLDAVEVRSIIDDMYCAKRMSNQLVISVNFLKTMVIGETDAFGIYVDRDWGC